MLILEASAEGKIIVALSDDSEIEIVITEFDDNKPMISISYSSQTLIFKPKKNTSTSILDL